MHVVVSRAHQLGAALVAGLLAAVIGCVVLASPSQANAYTTCVYAAHRGYTAHATENSMGAFRRAVYRNANYLEMDVQVTKDGQFVIMHDETINRTSNGSGRIINKTWDQLRQVRLNDGQSIPTLGAVLDMAKPTRSNVLLELKWIPKSRFAAVKKLIDGFGAERVVVNGFSSYVVGHFHEMYPDVKTALDTNGQISLARAQSYGGVMPDSRHVSLGWLADMQKAGVPVYLWTVDGPTGWNRYRGKVTLVLTNHAADYDHWRQTHCA
jgi:glycerophosphoryl diester phosphodiesterase